jgi:ornithine--oxo-acid transaminase
MNTGAEAVETALKICRKWGYEVKGIPENQAQIIVCENFSWKNNNDYFIFK